MVYNQEQMKTLGNVVVAKRVADCAFFGEPHSMVRGMVDPRTVDYSFMSGDFGVSHDPMVGAWRMRAASV